MKHIYLDNNATTQIAPEVQEVMLPFIRNYYGNPSSFYDLGKYSRQSIEHARVYISQLLNCNTEEIIFTSCGTESNNSAIWGILRANPDKKHIITSNVEHHAIGHVCNELEKLGYEVTYIEVDKQGQINTDNIKKSIRPDTILVSIMWANNETGIIFPIEEIARLCKEQNLFFHTDAVQAIGKIPVDLKQIPIDLLSLSGHKLHAPKGIGVLYLRQGVAWKPFLQGGGQENEKRAGTENVMGIVALGKAAELAKEQLMEELLYLATLRDYFEDEIVKRIPNILVTGKLSTRLPNTSHICFQHVHDYKLLYKLNEVGICASSGSACNALGKDASHVLQAMKIPNDYIQGPLRISLSRYTSRSEIDSLLDKLPPIIDSIRNKT